MVFFLITCDVILASWIMFFVEIWRMRNSHKVLTFAYRIIRKKLNIQEIKVRSNEKTSILNKVLWFEK